MGSTGEANLKMIHMLRSVQNKKNTFLFLVNIAVLMEFRRNNKVNYINMNMLNLMKSQTKQTEYIWFQII